MYFYYHYITFTFSDSIKTLTFGEEHQRGETGKEGELYIHLLIHEDIYRK